MQALKLLRRQVRSMWKLEEDMPPKARENHQWQFVAIQSGVPYLVGKGGANTFFYKIGANGEMKYGMPDEVFAVLDKWTAARFVVYGISRGKDLERPRRTSETLADLTRRLHDKYDKCFIFGLTSEGERVKLYSFKRGLMGNEWIKLGK